MDDTAKRPRGLVWLLRILGAIDLLAVLAVFAPLEWMTKIHAWLGMGELPQQPILHYLTRSASALYALHGAMILFVSTDVRRYAPLIKFLALAALIHGVVLCLIDTLAGMPVFWIVLEGPVVIAMGVVVLLLLRNETA